jgi:hypothetical protein
MAVGNRDIGGGAGLKRGLDTRRWRVKAGQCSLRSSEVLRNGEERMH